MSFEIIVKNWSPQSVSLLMPGDYVSKYRTLNSGEEINFSTEDEQSFWTPYSQVWYLPEKKIKLVDRKKFKAPEREFPFVKFLNLGGMDNEGIYMDTEHLIWLQRGIPRIEHVPVGSHYSQFSAVTLGPPKKIEKLVTSLAGMGTSARIEVEYRQHWIFEKRPAAEMEKLREMRLTIQRERLALGEI